MQTEELLEYFRQAYQTGSDFWTHLPYAKPALELVAQMGIQKDAFVLDIGSGRGAWAMTLAEQGYRVIGIDFVPEIVDQSNFEAKTKNLTGKLRFMEGNALDIPLADTSFDVVTEVGTLQHIPMTEWETYEKEVARVTKSKGYYLNISLSRATPKFMDIVPAQLPDGNLEKYGFIFHFFTPEEITETFKEHFEVREQKTIAMESKEAPGSTEMLIFSLLQKKV